MKIFIFISCVLSFANGEDILVEIPNGILRGIKVHSLRNVSFYAFLQIPFAKPPIGTLRFKAPLPAEKWNGVLNATISNKICFQNKDIPGYIETEDCLYLNVYTPQHNTHNAFWPVMVFIYGGGFVEGLGTFNKNGPHYFMEHDVIVVTISYRIGPFGFLTTGDIELPGNYGLKDQNLALRWVKANIKYFGGDPEKITIFGHSAGGASVAYHLMSKKSKGLFRAAIAMSGSTLCSWAYQRNYKHYGYGLATYLDPKFSKNASSSDLVKFLQNVPARKLKEAHESFMETTGNVQIIEGFWFAPVIEPEHDEAFITESMYGAIEKGHMNRAPLMIGICSEELIWWASRLDDFRRTAEAYDRNASLFVIGNMHITNPEAKIKAGKAAHNIYTNDPMVNDMGALIRYFGDTAFHRAIIHHAHLQSQFSDVYFYEFSYRGTMPNNKINIKGCDWVGHNEDQDYLWVVNNRSNINDYPRRDVLTSERYITLLTNFAKTLNPTPQKTELLQNVILPKVSPEKFSFLNINESLSIQTNPKWNMYNKWVKVYEEMAVKPYDTF